MKVKILLTIAVAFCSFLGAAAFNMVEVGAKLKENPELIADEDLDLEWEIDFNIKYNNYDELAVLVSELSAIPANSIRCNTIKKHYLPLDVKLLEKLTEDIPVLQEISMGREIDWSDTRQQIDTIKGKDIASLHQTLIGLGSTMIYLRSFSELLPIISGDAYFLEYMLWEETPYMEKACPLPLARLESATGRKVSNYSEFLEVLLTVSIPTLEDNQIYDLVRCLRFLPQGMVSNYTNNMAYVLQSRFTTEEIHNLALVMWEDTLEESGYSELSSLISYQVKSIRENSGDFIAYCDSLRGAGLEYAYKKPMEMKAKYGNDEEFLRYREKYMQMIYTVLWASNENNYRQTFSPFAKFGLLSFGDFIEAAAYEIFDRFYAEEGLEYLGYLVLLYDKILNSHTNPRFGNIVLELAVAYSMTNAKKSRRLLDYYGLDQYWVKERISNPEKIDHWNTFLRVASTIAVVHADLLNHYRHDYIKEILAFIGENIDKAEPEGRDRVAYDMAYAYYMIDEAEESRRWNPLESEEYASEARTLDFSLACRLGEVEKMHWYFDKNCGLHFPGELHALSALYNEREAEYLEDLVEFFKANSRSTVYQLMFMEPADQEWSVTRLRGLVNAALRDLASEYWISEWVIQEGGENMEFSKANNHLIAELVYDWALLSKGALMRSRNKIKEQFMDHLSPEQRKAYEMVANEFDLGGVDVQNPSHYVTKIADNMLLDMVRQNAGEYRGMEEYSFRNVRDRLDDGEVAVEFIDFYGEFYGVLIRKGMESPVMDMVVYGDDEAENLTNGNRVWRMLEDNLREGDRIYYSTDGLLNLANLDLITDEEGNPIFDKYDFVRVTSTLNIPGKKDLSTLREAAVFADLEYASDLSGEKMYGMDYEGLPIMYWEPLPDSEEEIASLQTLYPEGNLKVYSGAEGHKEAFVRLNGEFPQLLHVATHAFFWPYEMKEDGAEAGPMERSGIVLSGSEPDFYYSKDSKSIFAKEISNLDLGNVELVVLSACDGARGDITGDGVEGLQRGLKQSGAGSIIMSLDKVDSREITAFMADFYQGIGNGMDTRAAFSGARKAAWQRIPDGTWKYLIFLD